MAKRAPKVSSKLRRKKATPSTQQYLDILEIRDDTVIMKNGSLVGVLLVSSINFSLKSDEEQEAVIGAYVSFLNTIDFPLQIVIQSRRLDIDGYLDVIKNVEQQQTNELLKTQTQDYRRFVGELVQMNAIMAKRFYLIIPYAPKADRPGRFFSRLFDVFQPSQSIHLKQKQFDQYRTELFKRVENTMNALSSAGLQSQPLRTQELIELYYNSYNPETARQEKLDDVRKLSLEEVSTIQSENAGR